MTTHEVDFCGDRLRLAAFLRVVGKAPQRPVRCRRSVNGRASQQDVAKDNVLATTKDVLDDIAEQAAWEHRLQSKPSAAATPSTVRDETDEPRPTTRHGHSNATHPITDNTMKVKKAIKAQRRQFHTREKHHLPVNGLALVRTTSEIGLPSPSDSRVVFSPPVTDADPIEDCQLHPTFQKSKRPQKHHANHHERTLFDPKRRRTPWVQTLVSRQRGPLQVRITSSPIRKSTGSNAQSALATISDGFAGLERSHTMSKALTRASKRRTPKENKAFNSTKGGLALVEGPLPDASFLVNEPTHHESTTLSTQLQVADFQLGFSSTEGLHHVVIRSPQVVVDQQARLDEHAVRNQLSCITAPTRTVSDSEIYESQEDQDEDELADDVGNESGNTLESDDFKVSGATPPHARYTSGNGSYFAKASMFGLELQQDGGDFFWSHYGGMD